MLRNSWNGSYFSLAVGGVWIERDRASRDDLRYLQKLGQELTPLVLDSR